MTQELPTLSEPVEIGGVSFQTMVSSSVLTKPERTLDSTTSFQLGMRITNNSHQDYYFFCMSQNLIFEQRISSPHYGQVVRTDIHGDSRYFFFPHNNDVLLAESGESIRVVFNGVISWQKPCKRVKQRQKKIPSKIPIQETYSVGEESNYWLAVSLNFKHINFPLQAFSTDPLSYKIGCEYRMLEVVKYSKETYHDGYFAHIIPSILDKVWIGLVHTPFIEFHIV
jgi:hypothetical protein